ncbi:MAG: signal peptide peptidase SppA [Gammaproteobacteria bacterium]
MSRLFSLIGRVLTGLVKAVQILVFLVFVVVILSALANLSGGAIEIPESAALILAPSGSLVEQPEGEPIDRAFLQMQEGDAQTVVRDIVESLQYAAEDNRIRAVVLWPDFLQGGGLSKLQDVASAIEKFKESGKPVIAMADSYNQSQYYLAAHADEIYMHDFGFVMIEGFGYFKAYFADAIEKLKIDVNVFRVGEFKSFVEPYLRNDMSAEDKVSSQRWLDALWGIYRRDVIEARQLSEAAFDAYVNDMTAALSAADGDAGRAAIDAGFIDKLMNHQEFRFYITGLVGQDPDEPDTFANIDYRSYLTAVKFGAEEDEAGQPKVAVIIASGEIVDGEASPGVIGSTTLTKLIRQAAKDEEVAALVLRVDSPGGSMFASEVVLDQLQAFKAMGKPWVASMGSVAASGGYYISMDADEIWAAESTISGSIGVGAIFPTFQRSLGALGVSIDGIGSTDLSGQLSPVRELGDEARELLTISVRSAYDVFTSKVAEARDIDPERLDKIAEGRVWIGGDALEIGLVDSLGGLHDAFASAASLAGLAEDQYRVDYVSRELSFAEQLLLQYARLLGLLFSFSDSGDARLASVLQRLGGTLGQELALLDRWNDPRGIYYHCMCELR